MFEHEPERFGETKNRVGRFALGIREMEDREIGAVNVVVTVNQEKLHAATYPKPATRPRIFGWTAQRLAVRGGAKPKSLAE